MRALIVATLLATTPAFAQVVPAKDARTLELEREIARIQAFHGVTTGAQPEAETLTPPSSASTAQATPVPPQTHTVVKGDTLFNIAQRNAVSVDALKSANELEGTAIRLGQTLLIPSATPQTLIIEEPQSHALNMHANARILQANQSSGVADVAVAERAYAVLPGDTLFAIATRACVDLQALKTANGLAGAAISPGQRLTLPTGHCLK